MTTTESRRAQIIRVSTRLFSEQGYARTTLDDVAAEIGFTKPAIYHWFDSKDQILFEIHRDIVEPALAEVRTIKEAGGQPGEQLSAILRAHVRRVLDNAHANNVFARESVHLADGFAQQIRKLDGEYEQEVRGVYAAGVAGGDFADIDPVVAVGSLLSACSWMSEWFRASGRLSEDEVADMVNRLLAGGYKGAGQ